MFPGWKQIELSSDTQRKQHQKWQIRGTWKRFIRLCSGNSNLTKSEVSSWQKSSILFENLQGFSELLWEIEQLEFTSAHYLFFWLFRFNRHMSHYALRGQIIAYCNSLRALLDDFPTIRDTFFMVGQRQEKEELRDSNDGLKNDPRCGIFFRACFSPIPSPLLPGERFIKFGV